MSTLPRGCKFTLARGQSAKTATCQRRASVAACRGSPPLAIWGMTCLASAASLPGLCRVSGLWASGGWGDPPRQITADHGRSRQITADHSDGNRSVCAMGPFECHGCGGSAGLLRSRSLEKPREASRSLGRAPPLEKPAHAVRREPVIHTVHSHRQEPVIPQQRLARLHVAGARLEAQPPPADWRWSAAG